MLVESTYRDFFRAGRQPDAGLELGDIRRSVGFAEYDAEDSFVANADPQTSQGILGERNRRLWNENLLRISAPLTFLLCEPAHAFRVRKIDPSGIVTRFEQVHNVQRGGVRLLPPNGIVKTIYPTT